MSSCSRTSYSQYGGYRRKRSTRRRSNRRRSNRRRSTRRRSSRRISTHRRSIHRRSTRRRSIHRRSTRRRSMNNRTRRRYVMKGGEGGIEYSPYESKKYELNKLLDESQEIVGDVDPMDIVRQINERVVSRNKLSENAEIRGKLNGEISTLFKYIKSLNQPAYYEYIIAGENCIIDPYSPAGEQYPSVTIHALANKDTKLFQGIGTPDRVTLATGLFQKKGEKGFKTFKKREYKITSEIFFGPGYPAVGKNMVILRYYEDDQKLQEGKYKGMFKLSECTISYIDDKNIIILREGEGPLRTLKGVVPKGMGISEQVATIALFDTLKKYIPNGGGGSPPEGVPPRDMKVAEYSGGGGGLPKGVPPTGYSGADVANPDDVDDVEMPGREEFPATDSPDTSPQTMFNQLSPMLEGSSGPGV